MNPGKIIDRVRNILTSPGTEWPVIATEPATTGGLYVGYITIVAALPAIAGFIKSSLIGTSFLGVTVHAPLGGGLARMLLTYLLSLAITYVMALIINALATSFGGQPGMVQALKTVAYAWTASWIAGIGVLLPWIGMLILLAGGIYGIYLLYLGLPHTMKCPPDRAGGYTAVSVIIAIVLSWAVHLVLGIIFFSASGAAAMSGIHIGQTSSTVSVDDRSALGRLAAIGQRAEQASKELDAAQKSGDNKAQSAAMGKMIGAISDSNGPVEALAPDQIKAFLPNRIGGLKRGSLSARRNNAMGMQVSAAQADYTGAHDQRITLKITDTGGAKGFVAMATAMAPEQEKETDHGYEKTYSVDGNMIHEAWNSQSRSGEYSIVVGKRFTVKASGNVDAIEQLRQAVSSIDLGKLESLKNAGVKSN